MDDDGIFLIVFCVIFIILFYIYSGDTKTQNGHRFALILISIIILYVLHKKRYGQMEFLNEMNTILISKTEIDDIIEIPEEPEPEEPPSEPEVLARVIFNPLASNETVSTISFEFRLLDETPIVTDEVVRMDILIASIFQETINGKLNQLLSNFVSTEINPTLSILHFINLDGPVSDGSTLRINLTNYLLARDFRTPSDCKCEVYVGGMNSVNYTTMSDNLDNFDDSCAPLQLLAINAEGVPGTEDGYWRPTSTNFINQYGAGNRTMYRQYNFSYQNGMTSLVTIAGTTSNQQLWIAKPVWSPYWSLHKSSQFNSYTSNSSNVTSKWDGSNEGARITFTFSEPISNFSFVFFDVDGSANGYIGEMNPPANAWRQIAGGTNGAGIVTNANGITRYDPPGGDNDNSIYLYWRGPLTVVSFVYCEIYAIGVNPATLHCSIPANATIVS